MVVMVGVEARFFNYTGAEDLSVINSSPAGAAGEVGGRLNSTQVFRVQKSRLRCNVQQTGFWARYVKYSTLYSTCSPKSRTHPVASTPVRFYLWRFTCFLGQYRSGPPLAEEVAFDGQ